MRCVISKLRKSIFGPLPEECQPISDKNQADVTVSLTSYPPRFPTLHRVIESILKQSLSPARICLWIADQDMEFLPKKVRALEKFGLEIHSIPDFKSYNKIIHCYTMYPNSIIVTGDDDMIYPTHWLRLLYAYHLHNPETIICHRARYVTFQPNGDTNPYWLWPNLDREIESSLVFPLGVGGVLYPANCFHEDFAKNEIFMDLCKYGDDIWLKTMTLLKAIPCKKIHYYPKFFKHVRNSQKVTLKQTNLDFGNDEQIREVFAKYDVLKILQGRIEL